MCKPDTLLFSDVGRPTTYSHEELFFDLTEDWHLCEGFGEKEAVLPPMPFRQIACVEIKKLNHVMYWQNGVISQVRLTGIDEQFGCIVMPVDLRIGPRSTQMVRRKKKEACHRRLRRRQ